MRDSFKQRRISALGTLAVFVLFALCMLSVLLSGAGAYRRLVQQGSESYALRTCEQYIATRVRQCARGELVSVESFGECCALVLREDVEGVEYLTRIYCHEGWLMELFAAADGEFQPEDGEIVVRIPDIYGKTDTVYTVKTCGGEVTVSTVGTKPYSVIVHR